MIYTIIGGLNGVGKSTIYSSLSNEDVKSLGRRINVDEIVLTYGDWRDTTAQFLAGKQAVKQINNCLDARVDFHQETTLAGQSIIKTIKTAKALGYTIHLWYIYVSDVQIAKQRMHDRVANGGHGVSDEVFERRSITSLKTLQAIIPLCNEVRFYDNTTAYYPTARLSNQAINFLDKNIPTYILSCLEQDPLGEK